MIPLRITANLDIDPWTDLRSVPMPHNPDGQSALVERIGVLPNGTARAIAVTPVALMEDL